MDKEEILAKARVENKGRDFADLKMQDKSLAVIRLFAETKAGNA